MLKLDNRDIEILKILSAEARISKAELANRINLSPTPCWERLRRLEKAGIIRSYKADISLKGIAANVTIFVTVELENHRTEAFQSFEIAVKSRSEIVACWALGGGFDYLMQIVTYQRLMDSLLEQGLGLKRYYTYIVTKPVKENGILPFDTLMDVEGGGSALSGAD
jgi:Lrp/AsnC family transcriptional regulator, regulator of ectoine-degradation genes